ncbi:MAG TPA: universal stress protein [Hyphomicrobiaceae bacterium]|jgi:nucleotide-binding universal stress UspA family protein|nr:universal stress protein [Hyphomicrobiaceae bacterium]
MAKTPQPKKPRNILLATDLTAAGDRAFDRAVQLAKEWGGGLTLCHVVEASSLRPIGIERRIRNVDAEMTELEKRASAVLKQVVSKHVVIGDPAERVIEHARAIKSDFVVTGPAHTKIHGERLLGSTAARILRQAHAPVLAVRRRPTGAYKNIAVSVDFSTASRDAVITTRALFPTAALTLVNAFEVQPDWSGRASAKSLHEIEAEERARVKRIGEQEMARLAGTEDRKIKSVMIEGQPGPVLSDYVDDKRPDMIVTGTYSRAGTPEHMIGSTAEILLNTLPCDVLAIRPEG